MESELEFQCASPPLILKNIWPDYELEPNQESVCKHFAMSDPWGSGLPIIVYLRTTFQPLAGRIGARA